MKPGFTAKFYRNSLNKLMTEASLISRKDIWKGRLLAFPLGLFLLVTVPLEKLLSFFEALLFAIVNLLAPFFPKNCSIPDLWISLRRAFFFFFGLLLSPFTAIFVAAALVTTMIIHPAAAAKRFADQCKD